MVVLISEQTEEKINLLIQAMFNHNRSWDRFIAVAQVDWSMDNFVEIFHDGLAHLYPLLGDFLGDILLRYNIAPKYYETKRDTRTYSGMLDFFEINLNEHIETYELIKLAIQTAIDNGDLNVETDLKQFLRIWNQVKWACTSRSSRLARKSNIHSVRLSLRVIITSLVC